VSSGGKNYSGLLGKVAFFFVKDVGVVASFDTIFNYSLVSWTCDRLWCFVQLLWALVGVVPLDSALIAGNVDLLLLYKIFMLFAGLDHMCC
jgi:hypothetical protein